MKDWVKRAFNSYYTGLNGTWEAVKEHQIETLGFNYSCSFSRGPYIISNRSGWYFDIDWNSNTVSLQKESDTDYVLSAEQQAELNAAALEGSQYLTWLKTTYEAKCGVYKWR